MATGGLDPAAPGSIAMEVSDGGAVLHLTGEIDVATVARYESAAERNTLPPGAVRVIDAAAVTFFSSVGLGFILRMTEATRAAGRRPIIRRPPRPLVRVLQLTGVDDLFDLRPPPD